MRAVRLHDLHHVLTGYDTSWVGEAEIGAWELAGGCAHHYPAWVLNSGAFTLGLFLAPGRLFRAFVRGRHSRNLYRGEFHESLLDGKVGEMRQSLRLDRDAPLAQPAGTQGGVSRVVSCRPRCRCSTRT
ncbi:MAG TPA: hypothetical protein VHG28_00035 [Longimicrobiaceae bacterium]|nr:hypothetical protein [Longimicrobiaceae bacterium]